MMYEHKIIVPQFAISGNTVNMSWPGADAAEKEGTVSLLAAGDWASCRCYSDAAERQPEELYDGLFDAIRKAAVAVVNFECALAGNSPIIKEGPNLKGTAASCNALKAAGFDFACLGNNHSADFGDEGLRESLRLCRAAGLQPFGAGMDIYEAFKPVITEKEGIRIGMLAVADPEDGIADINKGGIASANDIQVLEHVRALKTACDVAVVFVHGGREYVPVPSLYWYDRVMAIAAAGADAVIGHHPHVPQGATVLQTADSRNVPVIFSTGNFIFRPALPKKDEIPPHTGDGYLVRLHLKGTKAAAVELLPYGIDGEKGVRQLSKTKLNDFLLLIRTLSSELKDRRNIAEWFDAVVDFQWTKHYRGRYETFTSRMLEGDQEAIRFVRNHHHSMAHMTLVDRALERQQQALTGTVDPAIKQKLRQWYEGLWPCGALGRPVAD